MFVVDAKKVREELGVVKMIFKGEHAALVGELMDAFTTNLLKASFWIPEPEDVSKACVDRLVQVRRSEGNE